jgi:hypothetical protein
MTIGYVLFAASSPGGGGSFSNPLDNAQGLTVCCVEGVRGTAEGQRDCSATQNTLRETALYPIT